MEAFESFVALALEAEGLVVSEAIKFPVRLQTGRKDHVEIQTHGYEVDLVGARADRLVLASVKSYLGSHGVVAEHVTGETRDERARKRYSLFNRREVRGPVIKAAAKRYGYRTGQVELRLYVGNFSKGAHEERVRRWQLGSVSVWVRSALWTHRCGRCRQAGGRSARVQGQPGSGHDEGA